MMRKQLPSFGFVETPMAPNMESREVILGLEEALMILALRVIPLLLSQELSIPDYYI
jgi:hypothetical protein